MERQTDRQTDRQTNSLTTYMGVCGFFLSVKYATSLLALLARGLNEENIAIIAMAELTCNVCIPMSDYCFPI